MTNDANETEDAGAQTQKPAGLQRSLKARALRMLSMREHTRQELARKLLPFEENPGELEQLLDLLEAKNFINAQRVVESVVNRRSLKLGASRVRQELQAKGLPAEAIAHAVQEMRSTELERATEVWRKKFGAPAQTAAMYAKQVRFLTHRGFDAEIVRRVVKDRHGEL